MSVVQEFVGREKALREELSGMKVELLISKEAFRQEQQELKAAIAAIEEMKMKHLEEISVGTGI